MDGLTNICEATSQSLDFESFRPTHRKGKKLMAEKKRRARINNCLMRIRDIVCDGEEEKETDLDKMEKAEILERTLEVLTRVRHDFDNSRKIGSLSSQKAMAVRYASGFSSCAEESIRYIQSSRLVPEEVKHQLQSHLRTIARRMEGRVQEEQDGSYTHPYTPASVVITPPQIVPLSSVTTPHLPTSSLSLILPANGAIPSQLQNSPSRIIDFQIANVQNSYSTDIVTSSSQNEWKPLRIPSPIHSSTPITHIHDKKPISPIPNKVFHEDNSAMYISVGVVDYQDVKENQPSDYPYNIPVSSERSHYGGQVGSAFHKIAPRLCNSSSPRIEEHSQQQRRNSSLSSSSPSVFSSSQYSPISPVSSPVSVYTSKFQTFPSSSTEHESIYSYHGYEPYPTHALTKNTLTMPVVSRSPTMKSEQPHTPNKVMDLCIRRNDSHNISPETMWRPW